MISLARRDERPLRIGHRGAAALAPENTLRSFRAARDAGVDLIEFDVLDLRGGELVVAHSDDLYEVSHGVARGSVRERALENLRDVCPDLPTLDDALRFFAEDALGTGVHLDLKTTSTARAVASALARFDLVERSFVSSFHRRALLEFAQVEPRVPVGISFPQDRVGIYGRRGSRGDRRRPRTVDHAGGTQDGDRLRRGLRGERHRGERGTHGIDCGGASKWSWALPIEDGERFDVRCIGKQVEEHEVRQAVTRVDESPGITRQRGNVARNIDDARGVVPDHAGDRRPRHAGARRIDDERCVTREASRLAQQRFDAARLDADGAAEGSRVLDEVASRRRVFLDGDDLTAAPSGRDERKQADSRVEVDDRTVGEPTGNKLATAHKGVLTLTLTARGRSAHSAFPERGESDILKLLDVLSDIRGLDFGLDPVLGPTVMNVGRIGGGTASNVIPGEAEAVLSFRTGVSPDTVLSGVRTAAAGRVEIAVGSRSQPQVLLTLPGFPAELMPYGTDIPHLTAFGRPLLLGPGSVLEAHVENERVEKSQLVDAVDMYKRLVRALRGE